MCSQLLATLLCHDHALSWGDGHPERLSEQQRLLEYVRRVRDGVLPFRQRQRGARSTECSPDPTPGRGLWRIEGQWLLRAAIHHQSAVRETP